MSRVSLQCPGRSQFRVFIIPRVASTVISSVRFPSLSLSFLLNAQCRISSASFSLGDSSDSKRDNAERATSRKRGGIFSCPPIFLGIYGDANSAPPRTVESKSDTLCNELDPDISGIINI